MPRILLAEALDAEAEARLRASADVVTPESTAEAALCSAIRGCDAMVARTSTRVTRLLLETGVLDGGRLRIIGVAGVGLDRVDIAAARELGVELVHTPAAASDAVAELTIELMLMLLRPVPRLAAEYKAGRYREVRERPHGDELRERTVGIVGMGRIGARVARICAAGFGARVLYNDIADVGPFSFAATREDKATLWRESDIITLHVPLTADTRGLISADVLGQFRPGARLINTARGAVIDTAALTAALQNGQLGGAGLDVTHPEPLPSDHPLFSLESCILTPHIAARTHGGLRRMFDVVDRVLDILKLRSRAKDGSNG
jgi:D-3-phosphoglycerate dehydrogenase